MLGDILVSKVNEFNRECFKNNNNLKKEIESPKKNRGQLIVVNYSDKKIEIIWRIIYI